MKAYDNYIFDLYGTLVDIHTEENDPLVWKKLALFYGYYDANYAPEELKERYAAIIAGEESKMKSEKKMMLMRHIRRFRLKRSFRSFLRKKV